jgi:hypothetical protein
LLPLYRSDRRRESCSLPRQLWRLVLAIGWEEQEISNLFGWTIANFVLDRDLGGVLAHIGFLCGGTICTLDLSEVTISAVSWPINSR